MILKSRKKWGSRTKSFYSEIPVRARKRLILVSVCCNIRAKGLCVENVDFFVSVYHNKRVRGLCAQTFDFVPLWGLCVQNVGFGPYVCNNVLGD